MDAQIPLYLLHPMAVHFPIALLAVGWLAAVGSARKAAAPWLRPAAFWMLMLGVLGLWAALGLGLLAAHLAPHEPSAWRVMALHQRLAYYSAFAFSLVALAWRWAHGRRFWALLLAWGLAYGLLAVTAHQGGRLVF